MSDQHQHQANTPKPAPPEGYYDFVVGHAAWDDNTTNPNLMDAVIEVRFVVPNEGERIAYPRLYFSDAAKPYSIEKLQAMGFVMGEQIKTLVGAKGRGRVKYETYKDPTTNETKKSWKFEIVSNGGFKIKNPPTADKVAAFEKMLGSYVPPGKAAKNGTAGPGYPADWDGGAPSGAEGFSLDE